MDRGLKKGSFIKRVLAYVIDYLIVVILVSLISSPFVDAKKTETIDKESTEIIEKYQQGEISAEEYVQRYSSVYYSLNRTTGVMTFITIIIDVLYFVVLQFYNKGQTLGKMIMRIRVVSRDRDLSMNQMIFRGLIANMILINIINFALITFASKNIFMGVSVTISMIQYIIMFISLIMLTTKEGRTIHDRVANTMVVRED